MEWTYRISAEARPRVVGRIAQVFEQQIVALRAFHMTTVAGLHEIAVTVDVDAELAHRIHAKLWKQVDLVHVELVEGVAGGGAWERSVVGTFSEPEPKKRGTPR